MMRRGWAVWLLALGFAAPAAGEERTQQETEPETDQTEATDSAPERITETVVVTAAREETPLLTTPAGIAIRTADEIAAEAGRGFADVLDGLPGVRVQGNSRRITEEPNIRGFADEQVIIRQDGGRQNFNGVHAGRFFVDPDLLQRIEVVRGAGSALYGSGALGGVVALTTRSARDLLDAGQSWGGRYRLGYQSNGSDLSQSFSAFGANRRVDGLASVTLGGTRQAIRDGNGTPIPNTEDDLRNGLLKLGWNPGLATRLEVSFQRFASDGAEPINANALTGNLVFRDTRWDGFRARFETRSPDSDLLDLNVVAYSNALQTTEDMIAEYRADTTGFETLGFEAHNTARFRWSDSLRLRVGTGIEAYRDEQTGTRNGEPRLQFPDAEFSYAAGWIYAKAEIRDRFDLTASIRRDGARIRSDRFETREESRFSPQASAGVRFGNSAYAWVGASRAFRIPSLNELYADGVHFQIPIASRIQVINLLQPSPDLPAERGASQEAGLRGGWNSFFGETTCFRSEVDGYVDQVVTLVDPSLPAIIGPAGGESVLYGSTVNRSVAARLRGCEAVAQVDRPRFRLRLSGALLDTGNRDSGIALASAPASAAHLLLSGKIPSLSLEIGGRASVAAARSEVPDQVEPTEGYRVFDVFARFRPESGPLRGADWTIALNNLTDSYFAIHPAVVPQPGRSFRISAAWRLGFPR